MIYSTPLSTRQFSPSLPSMHHSVTSRGAACHTDPVSRQRDGETDVTLRRPLPLPLSTSGYCSELQLTDEPCEERRGRIPWEQRLLL